MSRFHAHRNRFMTALAVTCVTVFATLSTADERPPANLTPQADIADIARLESRLDRLEAALITSSRAASDEALLKSAPPIVSNVVAFVSVVVALVALRSQRKARQDERELSRRFKSTEVATWCIDRFYDIHEDHKTKDLMYYNRLWGLHYAQFNHYKNASLDSRLYETWLDYLRRDYKHDLKHQDQWERIKREHINDEMFVKFIEAVLACENSGQVKALLTEVPQVESCANSDKAH